MSSRQTMQRAKRLRREMSPAETRLWCALLDRPGGHKFRRQHPAGRYVLDFYCSKACLCIEVDGLAHDMGDNPQRDLQRDEWLAKQGIETLRIPAVEIFRDVEPVVQLIAARCASRSPSTGSAGPPPLPKQGRISRGNHE